jgi:hypothetical protein
MDRAHRIKTIFLLLLLVIVTVYESKSQTGFGLYPIEDQYNSSKYNPAFLKSEAQFTFSIFPFSGTSVGYNNQNEIQHLVSKLLSGMNTDEEYVDLAKIMVDRPTYNQRLENELLSFTYRAKDGFWNFRVSELATFSASLKGPVSLFMIKPEVKTVEIDKIQEVPALILHYREYSIGYSTPDDKRDLSLGVRAKLYFGKASFSSGIYGSVKELGGTYYLKMMGKGKMSMPESGTLNDDGTITTSPSLSGTTIDDYLMNSGNPGFGIDLGAKYQISPELSVSASLIDIGKINWKKNLNSKNFDGDFLFKGWSVEPIKENGVHLLSKTSDSISFAENASSLFQVKPSKETFSTTIPLTFYAGINYRLNPIVQFNLTERFIRIKDMNHNSFSFTANIELNNRITLNTGLAAIGNSYDNIPIAFLFNPDFGQVYLATDNILSLITPETSEYTGFSVGACFYLFRKRDLYSDPTKQAPYHRPKKVKKSENTGRIKKEYDEFYPQ